MGVGEHEQAVSVAAHESVPVCAGRAGVAHQEHVLCRCLGARESPSPVARRLLSGERRDRSGGGEFGGEHACEARDVDGFGCPEEREDARAALRLLEPAGCL